MGKIPNLYKNTISPPWHKRVLETLEKVCK